MSTHVPPRAPSHLAPALAALAVVAGLAALRHAELAPAETRTQPDPAGAWIDPAAARVVHAPEWVDPRWLEELAALCARVQPFEAGASEAAAALAAELAALSFVARVEHCEASPAGLAISVLLREPIACIPARAGFALVDEDGVVLAGHWPQPPRLGRAYLPVIGPLDDPLFARARAGDWLVEREHLDALDVALSLAENLGPDERAELGQVLIDARAARHASVRDPGVLLELEGQRTALFGRAPSCGEPGELAARAKWEALRRALQLFARDPLAHDWERVDLRWDRPDIALSSAAPVALAAPATERPRVARARDGQARDESRAHVR